MKIVGPGEPLPVLVTSKDGKHPLTAKDLKQIEVLSGLRLPVKKIALVMGIPSSTFEIMVRQNKVLECALESGRAQASAKVVQTAFAMATSGAHPSMTMFWLKTQEGWREKERPDLPEDSKSEFAKMTVEERKARLAELERLRQIRKGGTGEGGSGA